MTHQMMTHQIDDIPKCERHTEMRKTHLTAKDAPNCERRTELCHDTTYVSLNDAYRMIKAVEVNARGSIQAIPCPQPPCGDVVASLGVTVAWLVGK